MKKIVLNATRALVLVCAMFMAVSCASSIDKQLKEAVEYLDAMCPQRVDQITTIDEVLMGEGREIIMKYTVDIARGDENFDYDSFPALMKNYLNERAKSQDMAFIRQLKATMTFIYDDRNGEELFNYSVTPEMYE